MSTSLHSLPNEVRSEIFSCCFNRDLVNFAVSSKSWCGEVIPILWRKVALEWEALTQNNANCKTFNLKHTRNLRLHGQELNLGNYGAFNYCIILHNCDPAKLTSLCIEDFVIEDGLRLASEMLPLLKSVKRIKKVS